MFFESKDGDFHRSAKFLLAVYEGNLNKAFENISCDFEIILENFVEMLCGSGHIRQAEELTKVFCFDDDDEDVLCDDDESENDFCASYSDSNFSFLLIEAYLNSGNVDEAKRVRNEIKNTANKWLASRLIAEYLNK